MYTSVIPSCCLLPFLNGINSRATQCRFHRTFLAPEGNILSSLKNHILTAKYAFALQKKLGKKSKKELELGNVVHVKYIYMNLP